MIFDAKILQRWAKNDPFCLDGRKLVAQNLSEADCRRANLLKFKILS